MTTHLYAFGSLCRGEVDKSSDIDLLACLSEPNSELEPTRFSIYSHDRIKELWLEGNPFAWHLHLESRLVYSSDGIDFISNLGQPASYSKLRDDCEKFRSLFLESFNSLITTNNSRTFYISCMFLATRNFATCYSIGSGAPVFSRNSPMMLENKLPISNDEYDIYVRARILSTRGYGYPLSDNDVNSVKTSAHVIVEWMNKLADHYLSLELRNE